MANLTEQELGKIQDLVNQFNAVKIQLGDTVISQNALLKSVEDIRLLYAKEEKELIEKYGKDCVINVQTGEITEGTSEQEKE